jgi:hypothetical protein
LIKTLFISLVLALASYALFQPQVSAGSSVEMVPSVRIIYQITAGMTMDELVQRAYPDDKDLWPQIKQKLIETNPTSFYPNSERLIPGVRLKLVEIKRIHDQPELDPKTKIGYVDTISGKVIARDVNGRGQVLLTNSVIFQGDRLETETGAKLHVVMDDGAEIFLKQNSVLKVSEYVITDGYDEDSSSIFDLLRGGLRKITGAIGASNNANYQVQTGLATIGIRGTEYVIKLCKQDDCTATVSRNDPDAKLHAVVLDGSITLTSDDEVQILMALGEYGTATSEEIQIEEEAPVPVGFLDEDEAYRFNVTVPQQLEQQQMEQQEEEESSNSWLWIVGILLLVVGL